MGTNLALTSNVLPNDKPLFHYNMDHLEALETAYNKIYSNNPLNLKSLCSRPNDLELAVKNAESALQHFDKMNAIWETIQNAPDPATENLPFVRPPPTNPDLQVLQIPEAPQEALALQEEHVGDAVEEADLQAEQAPEPDQEQMMEEALFENLQNMDLFSADLNQMDQEENFNQKSSSSSLLFSDNSPQESQQSAQVSLSKKNSDAPSSPESFNARSAQLSNSQPANLFLQKKSNSASERSQMQADLASTKTLKSALAAKTQDTSSMRKNFVTQDSFVRGKNAQFMLQTPQEANALKAQLLKNDKAMSQNAYLNANKTEPLQDRQSRSLTNNSSSAFAFFMANGQTTAFTSSLKSSILQSAKESSSGNAIPLTGKTAKQEALSTNPSLSSDTFKELKEIAVGFLQLAPQERVAMGNTLAMLPIDHQISSMLSLISLSQPISFTPMNQPSRTLNPPVEGRTSSKTITAIAAGPAPVLLSNSSAMNTMNSEKSEDEEEEEESDENVPLIRAVVFGTEEIIDAEMLAIIEELKSSKVKLSLLSQGEEHSLFDLNLPFKKPDLRSYDALIEAIDLPAEEILLIDKDPARIQGAKVMGLDAITFTSIKQLKEELIKKKLLI